MICRHCQQPLYRCAAKKRNGTCWYFNCRGWKHVGSGHTCADFAGDAEPEPGTLPATETPTSKPHREVA